jgi:hypothetical protein
MVECCCFGLLCADIVVDNCAICSNVFKGEIEATGNCLGSVRLGVLHCFRKGVLQRGRGGAFLQRRCDSCEVEDDQNFSFSVSSKRRVFIK